MKKLTVLMCSWRSPHLLKASIPSLQKSFTVDAEIKVVLNEADSPSVNYLQEQGIEFVALNRNIGTSAVDCASHLINSEYVANVNDDMLFHPGWDSDLIGLVERNYPASASCHLVEPVKTLHPASIHHDLGKFEEAYSAFIDAHLQSKFSMSQVSSYVHPIIVKTRDYMEVGGYSDLFDPRWYPGGALDDFFAWRLWTRHGRNFRFITSGKSAVYHGHSMTTRKLPPEIRALTGYDYFRERTGMPLEQFRSEAGVQGRTVWFSIP